MDYHSADSSERLNSKAVKIKLHNSNKFLAVLRCYEVISHKKPMFLSTYLCSEAFQCAYDQM